MRYEGKDQLQIQQITSQPEIYKASFKLTTHSFDHLHKKNLPEEILQALQPLEEQRFATKRDFLQSGRTADRRRGH